MAIAQGFGKTATNNLIFGYDTGDMDNSFKGAPKTNLLGGYSRTYGNQSSSTFKTQYYTREIFVPTLGVRSVETMETYNDYGGGSGVCCQGAWGFGGSGVSGSTQYTYSIIYRSSSGYTHPNFMYRYEYGASGYITEGGLHNDGNRIHLGDGWYHAWGNMTTQPGTTSMSFYFYMYEYATYNTIDIAGVMFTQGPEILRPRQFIPFSTTRSVTQGLLDLAGLHTTTLANVSYSTTGALMFDGSDDSILVGTVGNYSNSVTCEAVLKTTRGSGWNNMLSGGCGDIIFTVESNRLNFGGQCNSPIPHANYSTSLVNTGNWVHSVATYDGSQVKIYINGALEATYNRSGSFTPTSLRVGSANGGSSEFFQGELPVIKLYNRAITEAEVLQNFNHYKTRFEI